MSYAGTPYIPMLSIRQGLITKERSRQAIREMISMGWRCDVETYNRVMDVMEKRNLWPVKEPEPHPSDEAN